MFNIFASGFCASTCMCCFAQGNILGGCVESVTCTFKLNCGFKIRRTGDERK